MNQIKTLLREILGELRMIHAELNALRTEQSPLRYSFTVPIDEGKSEEWYRVTWTGETQENDWP